MPSINTSVLTLEDITQRAIASGEVSFKGDETFSWSSNTWYKINDLTINANDIPAGGACLCTFNASIKHDEDGVPLQQRFIVNGNASPPSTVTIETTDAVNYFPIANIFFDELQEGNNTIEIEVRTLKGTSGLYVHNASHVVALMKR